jgi:aspartate/methionine/tyrosine aminotransferase
VEVLSDDELKVVAPVKWHEKIPPNGISLGIADVDFKGPEGIVQFLRDSLQGDFSFYQDQSGLDVAINAVQRFFNNRGVTAEKENIQIIPGTMLGIYAAMKWVSRRDGKVVCLGPIYEPIHRHATDVGNEIAWVPIADQKLDLDQLGKTIDDNTKMIALCNPTNPIGHVFSEIELKAIRDYVVDLDIACFSDELYEPLVFSKKHIPMQTLPGMEDRTISLYGFSKAYGLAGYRSGFMYFGSQVSEEVKGIINSQLVSPSPIASFVCQFALEDPQAQRWVNEFKNLMEHNTRIAARMFQDEGYSCDIPSGCFFIFPNIRVSDEPFVEHLLSSQGIQVVPGSHFGPTGENHIRINCGTSEVRLLEALQRIFTCLASYKSI